MIENDLFTVLLRDVSESRSRLISDNTDAGRRDLVRTVFAAIDGIAYLYREFVRDASREIGMLSAEEEHVLQEKSYFVNDRGKIVSQQRYLPTSATIRLASHIAARANPRLAIDFETEAWNRFNLSMRVRNRITHPKSIEDMKVSDSDLENCLIGFYWLLESVLSGMEASIHAMRDYKSDLSQVLKQLEEGDPDTWAEYQSALSSS